MAAWCLVSPASRGVGFAVARHLLQTTKAPIVATARQRPGDLKSKLLQDLENVDPDRLSVLTLDVMDESSIASAAETVQQMYPHQRFHLRQAHCIPGILHAERKPADIREDVVLESFRVNTIGPMLLAKHFVPFLPRKTTNISPEPGLADHAVYSSMSARVGSTHDNRHGGWYSYRASKAGVTSFMKSLDIYLQAQCGEKAMAIAQHPGTVKTDLSRDYWDHVEGGKLFSPEYAAERLVHVATNLGLDGRGKFWDWQMKEILP